MACSPLTEGVLLFDTKAQLTSGILSIEFELRSFRRSKIRGGNHNLGFLYRDPALLPTN